MGQVIKLGAQGKKELAVAFKVTMAYVGQVLSGQKKGGKAPAIWEAAKTFMSVLCMSYSMVYLFRSGNRLNICEIYFT